MPTFPISHVKAHLADSISAVRESGDPLVITQNGEATAVLVDAESYERTRRALAMLKLIAHGERDIERGSVIEQDSVFESMRARYGEESGRRTKKRRVER